MMLDENALTEENVSLLNSESKVDNNLAIKYQNSSSGDSLGKLSPSKQAPD